MFCILTCVWITRVCLVCEHLSSCTLTMCTFFSVWGHASIKRCKPGRGNGSLMPIPGLGFSYQSSQQEDRFSSASCEGESLGAGGGQRVPGPLMAGFSTDCVRGEGQGKRMSCRPGIKVCHLTGLQMHSEFWQDSWLSPNLWWLTCDLVKTVTKLWPT